MPLEAANASPRIPPLTVVFASVARLRRTLDLTAGLMATQQHGRREDGGVRGRHDQRFKASTSRTARNCAPVKGRREKRRRDSVGRSVWKGGMWFGADVLQLGYRTLNAGVFSIHLDTHDLLSNRTSYGIFASKTLVRGLRLQAPRRAGEPGHVTVGTTRNELARDRPIKSGPPTNPVYLLLLEGKIWCVIRYKNAGNMLQIMLQWTCSTSVAGIPSQKGNYPRKKNQ
ncbi:hypothetical protein K438DRAFT_1779274 [Mycena galopus ATCC 62051]|nr:hypothetical protein K438DRAFT_1779274 [Mycena galopus ATCC 62051]